jgi:hypothetical protein
MLSKNKYLLVLILLIVLFSFSITLAIDPIDIDWENRKCPEQKFPDCSHSQRVIPQYGWDENFCVKSPTCCGNDICEGEENSQNCIEDCKNKPGPVCGNGICERFENTICSPCAYQENPPKTPCLPCSVGDCPQDCEKEFMEGCLKEGESGTAFAQICCLGLAEKYSNENTGEIITKFICLKCNGDYCYASKRLAGFDAGPIEKETKANENTIVCPKIETIKCTEGVTFPAQIDEKGCTKSLICVKRLSNGKEKDIKVMPYQASENATKKLGDLGWNITLKTVGQGDDQKYVYNLEGNEQSKFLGFLNINVNINAQLDSFTGEIINIKKPWWSFLAW